MSATSNQAVTPVPAEPTSDGAEEPVPAAETRAPERRRARFDWFDLAVVLAFLGAAVAMAYRVWRDPAGSAIAANPDDHVFFEWVLAHAADAIKHGESPFFGGEMNTPYGVNLMANTSVLAIAVPLAPLTMIAGPSVSFAVFLTFAFAATASSWYLVLSRNLVQSRVAAAVAGAFCAFGPALASQAQGHPNLVAQFLVPLIVWQVIRLPQQSWLRGGGLLALLIIGQFFLNEEVLFLTAFVLAVCVLVTLVSRPRLITAHWRAYLKGLAAAAGICVVVLAYPIYYQFAGPMAYHGLPELVNNAYAINIAAYTSFPAKTLFVTNPGAGKIAINAAEANAFFGWPLLAVLAVLAAWQWRRLAVRLAVAVAVVFGVLSWGATPRFHGGTAHFPGPWRYLVHLPLLNSVVPARLGLVVTAAIGVLIAVLLDRLLRVRLKGRLRWLPRIGVAALIIALIPLTPTPVATKPFPAAPHFLTSGEFRDYVDSGESIMMGDASRPGDIAMMRWSAAQELDFSIARGYFVAPQPHAKSRRGNFYSELTNQVWRLAAVGRTGKAATFSDADRAAFAKQLQRWKVGVIMLPQDWPHAAELTESLTSLMGRSPESVDDVLVWRV
ncbi:MAG: hypothetical protein HOU81_05420 [Hamadaea sp.]|uniref:hypothetical protein n=1 Tax=Hamadaea sp. TaxID=2024425 RepID=UPI00182AE6B5|nr:hypothetical protein [Hamadaea sp.]NUR70237.1 hypothetical protein [Hamadaea sp.]NUT22060.1 hypothetical protein [Hamadaea sp.]